MATTKYVTLEESERNFKIWKNNWILNKKLKHKRKWRRRNG
jgi:hypothetical protein